MTCLEPQGNTTMHSGRKLSSQHCCLPTVQPDSPRSERSSKMQVGSWKLPHLPGVSKDDDFQ